MIARVYIIITLVLKFMTMYYLYTISDPFTHQVKYVGITQDFKRRCWQHLNEATKFDDVKSLWIKETLDKGRSPHFELLKQICSKEDALSAESELIRYLISSGNKLLNTFYRKLYYKWSKSGELIEVVEKMRQEDKSIKMDRHTYLGFVWSDTPEFPKWKLDAYNAAKDCLKKKVAQIDKSGQTVAIFDGVRDAGRITGIDHRSISQVAAGSKIRKSAGGFKWSYV